MNVQEVAKRSVHHQMTLLPVLYQHTQVGGRFLDIEEAARLAGLGIADALPAAKRLVDRGLASSVDKGDLKLHGLRITRNGVSAIEQGATWASGGPMAVPAGQSDGPRAAPLDLAPWIERFRKDHARGEKTAFIMMRFLSTPAHEAIAQAIGEALAQQQIIALRADGKEYADDLFPNVRTYMHCCDFGVAVFDRLSTNDFNPNVSLEVGYMMALGKPVCLLKDRTLDALHTDLVGKLYKSFDTQDIARTLPPQIDRWLRDRGLARR